MSLRSDAHHVYVGPFTSAPWCPPPTPSPKSSPQLPNPMLLMPYSAYAQRSSLWPQVGSCVLHVSPHDLLAQLPKEGWGA